MTDRDVAAIALGISVAAFAAALTAPWAQSTTGFWFDVILVALTGAGVAWWWRTRQ